MTRAGEPLTILHRTLTMHKQVSEFWRDTQMQRLRNYEFVIGRQWRKKDYDLLMTNRRSADVYNLVLPIVLALSGTQKLNRQRLRCFPVGSGDENLAQVLTQVMRWSFDQCDKDFQFSRTFMDAVIGRFGWMRSYWSRQWDTEGMWYTDWMDPMRITIDPETQGDFHRTCNYLFDTPWLPGEVLINLYASKNSELAERMQAQISIIEAHGEKRSVHSWRDKLQAMFNVLRDIRGNSSAATYEEYISDEWLDVRNGLYRVVELHEKRWERKKYLVNTVTGSRVELERSVKDNHNAISAALERHPELMVYEPPDSEPVNYVTTIIPAFSADPIAAVPQDQPYDIQNKLYCYTPVFAYDFHPDVSLVRSVVDSLIDPQQAFNKLESTVKDLIVRHVGHGWKIKEDSISPNHLQDWESKEVGVNRFYKDQVPIADIPEMPRRELFESKADHAGLMEAISGVNANMKGREQTRDENATLYGLRVQQAGVLQAPLFDALKRTDRILGRHAIDGLQKYLREERWIRVAADEGAEPEELIVNQRTLNGIVNNLSVGRYDVELDTATYSATAKQEAFLQMDRMSQRMPAELFRWDMLVELSDIPMKRDFAKYIRAKTGLESPPGTPMPAAPPGMAAQGIQQDVQPMVQAMMQRLRDGNNISLVPDATTRQEALTTIDG